MHSVERRAWWLSFWFWHRCEELQKGAKNSKHRVQLTALLGQLCHAISRDEKVSIHVPVNQDRSFIGRMVSRRKTEMVEYSPLDLARLILTPLVPVASGYFQKYNAEFYCHAMEHLTSPDMEHGDRGRHIKDALQLMLTIDHSVPGSS